MRCDRRVRGQCAIRCELLLRGVDRCLRGLHRVAGVRDFFLRHGARLRDGQAATQVVLGLRQVGLAQRDLRAVLVVVDEQAAHLAYRLREVGFRLLQRDLRIGRVEHDQRVAGLDRLRVVRLHGDHGAGDLRRDLHDVAVHVGIVGVFMEARDEEVVQAVCDGRDHDDRDEQRHHSFALAVVLRLRAGGVLLVAHGDFLRPLFRVSA